MKATRDRLVARRHPVFFVFSVCPVTIFANVLRPAEAPAPGKGAFAIVRTTFRLRTPMSAASSELRLKITEEPR